jgi:hypothetical protein
MPQFKKEHGITWDSLPSLTLVNSKGLNFPVAKNIYLGDVKTIDNIIT